MSQDSEVLALVYLFMFVLLFLPFIISLCRNAKYRWTVFFLCIFQIIPVLTWLVALFLALGETRKQIAEKEQKVYDARLEELADRIKKHNKEIIRTAEDDLLKAHELFSRKLISEADFNFRKLKLKKEIEDDLIPVDVKNRAELEQYLAQADSVEAAYSSLLQGEKETREVIGSVAAVVAGSVLQSLFEE